MRHECEISYTYIFFFYINISKDKVFLTTYLLRFLIDELFMYLYTSLLSHWHGWHFFKEVLFDYSLQLCVIYRHVRVARGATKTREKVMQILQGANVI